jgi:hypothetical protein
VPVASAQCASMGLFPTALFLTALKVFSDISGFLEVWGKECRVLPLIDVRGGLIKWFLEGTEEGVVHRNV